MPRLLLVERKKAVDTGIRRHDEVCSAGGSILRTPYIRQPSHPIDTAGTAAAAAPAALCFPPDSNCVTVCAATASVSAVQGETPGARADDGSDDGSGDDSPAGRRHGRLRADAAWRIARDAGAEQTLDAGNRANACRSRAATAVHQPFHRRLVRDA